MTLKSDQWTSSVQQIGPSVSIAEHASMDPDRHVVVDVSGAQAFLTDAEAERLLDWLTAYRAKRVREQRP